MKKENHLRKKVEASATPFSDDTNFDIDDTDFVISKNDILKISIDENQVLWIEMSDFEFPMSKEFKAHLIKEVNEYIKPQLQTINALSKCHTLEEL
jgi:hypothetical protein